MAHATFSGVSVEGSATVVSDFVEKVRAHEGSRLLQITEKPYSIAEIENLIGRPLNPLQIYDGTRFEILIQKKKRSPEESQMLKNLTTYMKEQDNPSMTVKEIRNVIRQPWDWSEEVNPKITWDMISDKVTF